MDSLSGEPHWAMSMGSSREGIPSSSSATEKTRQQFLHRGVSKVGWGRAGGERGLQLDPPTFSRRS